jgi:DNA mismatch repair protein MutH
MQRANCLAGRSLEQLAAAVGRETPSHQRRLKGWIGELMEQCLGATAGSRPVPDFPELGIELKTVPINARGRPKESTYICTVALSDTRAAWETSLVRRKLSRVLWVPVEAAPEIAFGLRRVGNPVLWSPEPAQERLIRTDWEELTEMISLGHLERISSRHGRCLQIRPKAANGRALTAHFSATGEPALTLPRGFYLRAAFTQGILSGC